MSHGASDGETEVELGCRAKVDAWWKGFKPKIWNGEKKEFIGRTAISWAKIILFYIAFFGVTAAFFTACFAVFLATIDFRIPTFTHYTSMLKNNPGMNSLPRGLISLPKHPNSTANHPAIEAYMKSLDDEIEMYSNATNLRSCNGNHTATWGEACKFDVPTLGKECSADKSYGYPDGKPCVLLRINNVIAWDPAAEKLDPSEIGCFGNEETPGCKFYKINAAYKSGIDTNHIPVSCEEAKGKDNKDNLVEVKFYPPNGIPFKFYPYYNQPNFVPPVVFAQFKFLKSDDPVQVNCRLWTKNIKHDFKDRQGSVQIQLKKDADERTEQTNTTTINETSAAATATKAADTTISATNASKATAASTAEAETAAGPTTTIPTIGDDTDATSESVFHTIPTTLHDLTTLGS